jgi:hypothetical protein
MRERHLEYLPCGRKYARHRYCGTERSRGEQNASDEIMEAQELIKARTTELKAENRE